MDKNEMKIKKDLFRKTRTLKGNSQNRGITLIALIITVVILLILAGVSIAMLTGENGLIGRAKLAKDKHENAQIEEDEILKNAENEIDKIVAYRNQENYQIEKIKVGTLTYSFSSCGNNDYSNYSSTQKINITNDFEKYQKYNDNNFSYEIVGISVGYPGSNSTWCYQSSMRKPVLQYNPETGEISLTISVLNGYHDYIKTVSVDIYIFK